MTPAARWAVAAALSAACGAASPSTPVGAPAAMTPTGIELAQAAPPSTRQGKRTMQLILSAAKARLSLGEPAMFEVAVVNPGPQPLSIDEPTGSMEVEMHLVDRQTKEDLSYAMGKAVAMPLPGNDRWAMSVRPRQPVEIAPNASLRFTTDAGARLYLRPGTYDAYLTIEGTESNRVELTIAYSRATVALLQALAGDPAQSYSRREWATDWLARLHPKFKLALPLPDEPAASREAKEAGNRRVLEAFATWWQRAATRDDIDAILGAIQ